ncbi:unnamed protein product [Cunninghamella blakesleeana]
MVDDKKIKKKDKKVKNKKESRSKDKKKTKWAKHDHSKHQSQQIETSVKNEKIKSNEMNDVSKSIPAKRTYSSTSNTSKKPNHSNDDKQKPIDSMKSKISKSSDKMIFQTPTIKKYTSDSDSDSTDNEVMKNTVSKNNKNINHSKTSTTKAPITNTTSPFSKSITKQIYSSDSNSDNTDDEADKKLEKEKPTIKIKSIAKLATTNSTPSASKKYTSDSDSDSTDNELYKSKINNKHKKSTTTNSLNNTNINTNDILASVSKKYESDSDSDSIDDEIMKSKMNNKTKKASVTNQQKKNISSSSSKKYISNSDSDGTDNEKIKSTKMNKGIKPIAINKTYTSNSDSDSTNNEINKTINHNHSKSTSTIPSALPALSNKNSNRATIKKNHSGPRTSEYINSDSDDSDYDHQMNLLYDNNSDSCSDDINEKRKNSVGKLKPLGTRKISETRNNSELGIYSNNRLQAYRQYRNLNRDQKIEYRHRYKDEADKYNVQNDFFISDSDSDTDSNDSYNGEAPYYHTKYISHGDMKKKMDIFGWKLNFDKFTREETIKLEKRIKKICRREGLSKSDFHDMVLLNTVDEHRLLWRKIAKIFPNKPLSIIVDYCKLTYNKHRYKNKNFTKEDDEQLIEYVKVYGKDFTRIQELMDRGKKELMERYRTLVKAAEKLKSQDLPSKKTWTSDDIEKLYNLVNESQKKGWQSWSHIASQLDNKSTGVVCRSMWQKRNDSKYLSIDDKLNLILALKKQGCKSEMDFNMNKISDELGIPHKKLKALYLKTRSTIIGYEKMAVSEILTQLEQRFKKMKESLE